MSWSDAISGRTAESCYEIMITESNNPCAIAFGNKIGWANVETMMRDLGLSSTDLTGSILKTTPNDVAYFLYRLENGTLMPEADGKRLISYMKRQIYRDGIPAGTPKIVADKVGFLTHLIHDAGIVYTSKGQYVIVIMSDYGSWPGIADAAKQIYAGARH